ncbi:MAG: winged helix-turn-helix transcriptional regulator [Mesorhizobium sp.]|nr:metalloregulator ArsR/SmtB family transcription factor [Mesorhizobium sp.]MBN9244442.1 winged helix-turn-helix transcriptional regulator [Mesorhizobium sp.]
MNTILKDIACVAIDPERLAAGLAALAHPTRIEIVRHLAGQPACCCRDVVDRLDLAQSTVSQHLKVLVDAGLVRFSPDRQRSRYELDRAALKDLSSSLARLTEDCCTGC